VNGRRVLDPHTECVCVLSRQEMCLANVERVDTTTSTRVSFDSPAVSVHELFVFLPVPSNALVSKRFTGDGTKPCRSP
jgi:hypothetical protein